MTKDREEFEKWYSTFRFADNYSQWHEDCNRYTIMSEKQVHYMVWNAARGIDYKWKAMPDA